MDDREKSVLERLVEIDEHVSTADEIEPQKRRVGNHVVLGENHQFAKRFFHFELIFLYGEIALYQHFVHIDETGLRIDTAAGDFKRLIIDIGREDFNFVAVDFVF